MTKNQIENIILDNAGEIEFKYNGKNSGIDSYTIDGKHIFSLWYGENEKIFNSLDELLKYPMFEKLNVTQVLINS